MMQAPCCCDFSFGDRGDIFFEALMKAFKIAGKKIPLV
jgi:hypothetical protein